MKDEQLKVLTDQNSQLLGSLDAMEEEANRIQTEKLSIDEENRRLKDQNFELRNKTRAAETAAKKAVAEMAVRMCKYVFPAFFIFIFLLLCVSGCEWSDSN